MNACINPVTFFVSEESLYFILLEQDQDVILHLYILCDFIKCNDFGFSYIAFSTLVNHFHIIYLLTKQIIMLDLKKRL